MLLGLTRRDAVLCRHFHSQGDSGGFRHVQAASSGYNAQNFDVAFQEWSKLTRSIFLTAHFPLSWESQVREVFTSERMSKDGNRRQSSSLGGKNLVAPPFAAEGYSGGAVHFISDEVVAYGCGNGIRFTNIRDRSEDAGRGSNSMSSFVWGAGCSVGAVTSSIQHNVIAYAERRRTLTDPSVYVIR